MEDIGFPVVQKHDGIQDIAKLKEWNTDNKEGFVIKFSNNFRLKIKFDEYLRLHRIITQVSNKNIWEYLRTNQSMEEIVERVPDEFFVWVKETKPDLEKKFQAIENQCKKDYKIFETVKETALYFQTCKYTSILFSMLHNRDYKEIIWKKIKPNFEKPFANKEK